MSERADAIRDVIELLQREGMKGAAAFVEVRAGALERREPIKHRCRWQWRAGLLQTDDAPVNGARCTLHAGHEAEGLDHVYPKRPST